MQPVVRRSKRGVRRLPDLVLPAIAGGAGTHGHAALVALPSRATIAGFLLPWLQFRIPARPQSRSDV